MRQNQFDSMAGLTSLPGFDNILPEVQYCTRQGVPHPTEGMAMKRIVLCALVAFFSTAGIAAAQQKVSVCGTGDSEELLRTLGAAFEKANPGVSIVVPDSVGSDGGIKAAAAAECDFGRVARPLKDQEKGLNLTYKVFSFSPIVFVVDPATGVEILNSKQIVDIFSGKVVAWTEVGGKGGKIAVVNREAKDSSRGELNKHVEGFKAIEKPVGATAVKTPEAVDLLTKTPLAIGYLPAAMAKGQKLKVVKVNGVAPTAANVVQGIYKIAAPFGLVWKGELKPAAQRFYQFLKSAEGRKIIIDYGTVPADLL